MDGIDISRRKFLAAASWVGSFVLAGGLKAVTRASENGFAFVPQDSSAGQSGLAAFQRPRVLVFDVNQTLLDSDALRPHFERVFRDASALDEWFSLLLQYSLVLSVA